jgi:hypothetical protein
VLLYAIENKNMTPAVFDPDNSGILDTWYYKIWPCAGDAIEVADRGGAPGVTSPRYNKIPNIFICPEVAARKDETPMFNSNQAPNWNLYCYGLNNLTAGGRGDWGPPVSTIVSAPSRTCLLNESS